MLLSEKLCRLFPLAVVVIIVSFVHRLGPEGKDEAEVPRLDGNGSERSGHAESDQQAVGSPDELQSERPLSPDASGRVFLMRAAVVVLPLTGGGGTGRPDRFGP